MHEATVAASILRIVSEEAARNGIYGPDSALDTGSRVAHIDLQIGLLAGVEAQTLCGAFALLAEGTVAHGAMLQVHVLPMQGHCPQCKTAVMTDKRAFTCPNCQGLQVSWQGGNELAIAGIRITETKPAPDGQGLSSAPRPEQEEVNRP